jgi:hypothetical protein
MPIGGGGSPDGQHLNMDSRLQEIIDRGSPAQAELARHLPAGAQADLLYDAYLNDPYLTRN